MTETPELHLDAYAKAALESERARLSWMLIAFGLFGLIGIFRCIAPVEGAERTGPLLIAITIPYMVYEAMIRRMVGQRIAAVRAMPTGLQRLTPVVECSFPLVTMLLVIAFASMPPYTILVSPGYAMILVIVALSPLQLDPTRSVITGATGTVGYLALVIFVLARSDEPNPHPVAMYYMLTLMLAAATAGITFVTARVRAYVIGTVRELETRRRNEQMNRDLELARDIQRGLLPEDTPTLPGYQLAALSRSADQAGGDYYDWQLVRDGRLVVSLADVTGHGVGPALVTAACRAYVRALVDENPDPLAILTRVNQLIHGDLPAGRFVTFALIDIDSTAHEGVFLSAGHGPSLWMKGRDGSAASIDAQGLPLGILDDQDWDAAYKVSFEPDDVLVLFSDGFFETQDRDGSAFGLERLEEVVRTNRGASADVILAKMDEALLAWQGDQPQQDDMTAIVIKRTG